MNVEAERNLFWLHTSLKTQSLETLEAVTAESMGKLLGRKVNCSISSLKFERSGVGQTAAYSVVLSEPMDWFSERDHA
jgi:hypothetical protein